MVNRFLILITAALASSAVQALSNSTSFRTLKKNKWTQPTTTIGACDLSDCSGCLTCENVIACYDYKNWFWDQCFFGECDAECACECNTPGGTAPDNGYTCTDGTGAAAGAAYCAADEVCYAAEEFNKGEWSNGCRVECTCTDPTDGITPNNGYTCTDGTAAHCSITQKCFATQPFKYGEWTTGCEEVVE